MTNPQHVQPTLTGRGFARMDPIKAEHGDGEVQVYESSAASGAHVWLRTSDVKMGIPREMALHLTAEDAWRLAEQIMTLVRGHYQGDARPPVTERVADLRDREGDSD